MIQKKPEPYLDKLRIIELFEGDYVAMVKAFMRDLMNHTYDNGVKGLGTFATETGGSTHLAILSRVWAYDIARLFRHPIITLDNDSMGCYDRMVPPLLSLFLQRIGSPDNPTRTFIHQLLIREREVQTAYGLSDTIVVGQDEYMGGIGQGNPGGPACYHFQLLPLLLAMRDMTQGYSALDPANIIQYTQYVASYVDDCNSLVNLTPQEYNLCHDRQLEILIDRAQHTLTTWVDLIRLTGGEISITKSFWTLCSQWTNVQNRLQPTTPSHHPVLLIDGIPFPLKPPSTCERYLGVRVGISGAMDKEYTYRLDLSRAFAAEVYKLTSRQAAALAYQSYYLPKLTYP